MRVLERHSPFVSLGVLLISGCLSGCVEAAGVQSVDEEAVVRAGKVATTGKANPESAKRTPPATSSWASFRNGPQKLGVADSKLPEKLELLWKYPTEQGVVVAAAIVDEHVYVGAMSGKLLCLDRRRGKRRWSYRSIDDPDPEAFAPGFFAAPTVTTDTVYIGDEEGVFHAVNRATGKKRWTFNTEGKIASGATIHGDRVLFASHDGFLYYLKVADGSVAWKFPVDGPINCSPAIADKFTFAAGCQAGDVFVVDLQTGQQRGRISLETNVLATPAVLGDFFYIGTSSSEVLAVNWKQEKVVWRYKDPARDFPYGSSAAVTDKYVVVGGHDKQLHCIDRSTGEGVWTFSTRAKIDSSPAIAGARVFFGSKDRFLYCLRLKDGQKVPTFRLPSGKDSSKFHAGGEVAAGPAIGEGCLVISAAGNKGFIFCFGRK